MLIKTDLDRQDTIQSLWCGLRTLDEPKVSEITLTTSKHFYYHFLHNVMEEQQAEEEF